MEEHLTDIKAVIANAGKMGIKVNIYLEDWSNGIRANSGEYVFQMMDELQHQPIMRYMLPDTLGVLNPDETRLCQRMISRYPNLHFDFHAHNDYDMAVANVYEANQGRVRGRCLCDKWRTLTSPGEVHRC